MAAWCSFAGASTKSGAVPALKSFYQLFQVDSARRPISRVLSTRASPRGMAIHLGRPLPDASCDRPGQRCENTPALRLAVPTWSCSRWGLPCHPRRRGRGALLPHLFTLTAQFGRSQTARRFVFCGTFPGVASAGGYPAPCLRGARTFLPPPRRAERRPSGRLALLRYAAFRPGQVLGDHRHQPRYPPGRLRVNAAVDARRAKVALESLDSG